MKTVAREEARRLRREEGLAMRVIAERLGVAKSTVSTWTRDVKLTEEQHQRLRDEKPIYNRQYHGQEGRRATARAARLAAQERGRVRAGQGDLLHLQGCMLFWAEGSRRRNSVVFTNSDIEMHRVFLRFLRWCGVADEKVARTVNCHLTNGLTLEEIEAWWLTQLDLPASCLRAASVNRPSSASRWRRNVLVHGTACVRVHSTALVQSIYGGIQAYAGFERPEWLD